MKMQKIWRILGISREQADPQEMTFPVVKVLMLFSVTLGVTLLASNLAALKVWNLGGIPVDAGIWLFPLTYVVGDLLVETYGKKIANYVSLYCALFAVIVAGILAFAKVALPDFPGVDNSAFEIVQSATGRIFLASVAGFVVGQLINNGLFVWLRERERMGKTVKTRALQFLRRALLSSALAHLLDSLVFETLAFVGRVSFGDFVVQATFAYLAGLALEVILSPLTTWLAMKLHQKLHYTNGQVSGV